MQLLYGFLTCRETLYYVLYTMQPVTFCLPIFLFVLVFFFSLPLFGTIIDRAFSPHRASVLCLLCPIVLRSWPSVLLPSLCGHLFGCCDIGYLTWACGSAGGGSHMTLGGPKVTLAALAWVQPWGCGVLASLVLLTCVGHLLALRVLASLFLHLRPLAVASYEAASLSPASLHGCFWNWESYQRQI